MLKFPTMRIYDEERVLNDLPSGTGFSDSNRTEQELSYSSGTGLSDSNRTEQELSYSSGTGLSDGNRTEQELS